MSGKCWSCGVDQHPKRPRRADYDSDPAYLVACLVYLDHEYPERRDFARRVAEWEALEREADHERVVARIRELIALDDWTDDQQEEADRLMAIYLENRRAARQKEKTQ